MLKYAGEDEKYIVGELEGQIDCVIVYKYDDSNMSPVSYNGSVVEKEGELVTWLLSPQSDRPLALFPVMAQQLVCFMEFII